jgi:hypothetical protein
MRVRHHSTVRAILHARARGDRMVHVTASIVVHPEHAEPARTLLPAVTAATRREMGCLSAGTP